MSKVSSSIFGRKEYFLNSPAWDSVRLKCLDLKVSFDRYASDSLAALATLLDILKDLRRPTPGSQLPVLCKAKTFKARISSAADILQQELRLKWSCTRTPHLAPHACPPSTISLFRRPLSGIVFFGPQLLLRTVSS